MRYSVTTSLVLFSCLLCVAQTPSVSWSEKTLYRFQGQTDGWNPQSLAVGTGGFYGETIGGGQYQQGSLFLLSPPTVAGGEWTFKTLYSFGLPLGIGGPGTGGLLAGPNNTFFGVSGAVFEFDPSGTSQVTTLHSFSGPDGLGTVGPLVSDSSGNLYGVTWEGGQYNAGVVYELSPPRQTGGPWVQTVLYSFTGGSDGAQPEAGLIIDKNGALYGTTEFGGAGGTVFRLEPPAQAGGVWTETVLCGFTSARDGYEPRARLTMDHAGNLYGTTALGGAMGHGTVFRLVPPTSGGVPWQETVLHSFQPVSDGEAPMAGLSFGKNGVLYGTTAYSGNPEQGCGMIYSLTPSQGLGTWTETVLYNFKGGSSDGCTPEAAIVVSPVGALYSATTGGLENSGTIFELVPQK